MNNVQRYSPGHRGGPRFELVQEVATPGLGCLFPRVPWGHGESNGMIEVDDEVAIDSSDAVSAE